MNAHSSIPYRIPTDNEPDDEGCDLCPASTVAAVIHGDRMCASCADKWAEDPNDDLLPLSHPVMRETLSDWNAKYAGLSDDGLRALSKGQRQFGRSGL